MKIVALMIAAALAAAIGGPALAQGPDPLGADSLGAGWRARQDEARDEVRSGQALPLSRVIEIVARRVPGRLLNAGREGPNYRIRWAAADGRRIDFIVDARTGQILEGG